MSHYQHIDPTYLPTISPTPTTASQTSTRTQAHCDNRIKIPRNLHQSVYLSIYTYSLNSHPMETLRKVSTDAVEPDPDSIYQLPHYYANTD